MPTLTPEDDTVGALPAQTFYPFPRLPLELRQEIWKLAVPLTMNEPSVCRLGEVMIFWGDIEKLTVNGNSSLKLVCREARQAAIQGPPLRRVYDPLIDFLYFEDEMLFFHFTSKASVDDLARVKRVALSFPVLQSGLRKFLGLYQLTGLEELSIVYPKATGKIGVCYDVDVPETGPRMLRGLTEKEMSRFVIESNFTYYSFDLGYVHTDLERDARGHLDYIRDKLSLWTEDGRPPCWDKEKRELKLKMHALCFDEDGDEMF
ncbi:hypothetical protein CEP53_007526 [Fusarium sp. AF-6]|nr:hypothetical protein CEP53_007526 [Fusarium sp. AF-6]